MRGLRSTLILLLVLAGLVGYIYYDSKKPAASTDTKQKAFTGVTADAIEELQIKAADGETSRVQKSGDQWKLADPVNADADGNEVSSVTTSLASLDINRVVDENPSNLKEYGLDP